MKLKVSHSHPTLCSHVWFLYSPWNSLGQNTGVGSHSPLQGIFPTQGSNPGLPHCRQILYQLRHNGSPSNNKSMLKIPKNLLLQETLRVESQEFIYFFMWHTEHLHWEEQVIGNLSPPPPFRDSRSSTPSLGASGCPLYWRKLGYKQSSEIWMQTSQFGTHFQIWAVLLNRQRI